MSKRNLWENLSVMAQLTFLIFVGYRVWHKWEICVLIFWLYALLFEIWAGVKD